jgi:hypothetical protein
MVSGSISSAMERFVSVENEPRRTACNVSVEKLLHYTDPPQATMPNESSGICRWKRRNSLLYLYFFTEKS